MQLKLLATATAACALILALDAAPAEAQSRFREARPNGQTLVVTRDESGRTRTRIIVQRRSFLDAGTEVLPGERKYTDYVIPPYYSPTREAFGPGSRYDFRRQPLPDPWDLPQRGGYVGF